MKVNFKYIQLVAASMFAMAAMITGCQKPDYPTPQPSTAGYNTTSTRVLFVNATPDASSLNFQVDNTSIGQPLAPGAASAYVGLPLGAASPAAAQIRIQGAGGTLANDIISKPVLLANTSYTLFVTDTINRPVVKSKAGTVTDVGGVRTLTVVDTLTAPAAGTAKFRLFNLSPDVTGVVSTTEAAPVSVRVLNSAGTVVATLNNRAYRIATGAILRYTVVPADTYTVQVYSATAVPSDLAATPLASTTVALADGKIYSLYTKGLRRNNTLSVGTVQHN